jgi:WD40 repeat protein/serine/threonine protein kinase
LAIRHIPEFTAMNERSVFLEALEIGEPDARAAYLDRACHCNPALRRGVEELLAAHGRSGSFMSRPASGEATADCQPIAERPGTVLGPYKLMEQLGEGGMGLVFVAEQQQPVRRKVALKIIKPGMDSKPVIARFEAERQALALMDHQNIAKVLDAGATESGRLYFVMELVHGIPITDYCDAHKLTPRERLELFLPVCHAVQHAHQKGIIHRDLKPSNILVTMYDDKPVPKVIDFGVAKAIEQRLTEKTVYTQFGTLVGTFEYMSPEQAEMNAFGVDTRSDVYALGVLLYELLTGTTPLERQRLREAAYGEIVRLIKEEEPPPPSTRLNSSRAALAGISRQRGSAPEQLTELVRGELDWIAMRCLEKDRTRRYETANGLAKDVERYLKDEPVEACPPTAGYRLRKFARKNKRLLATAAAFTALLLLGVVASAWQAVRATQAEVAANTNAVQAQEKEQEAKQQRDEAKALAEKLRATQTQLRSTLYAAHMNLAQHALEAGGTGRVRELLEQHRPTAGAADLRGFEWHYLDRLCHSGLLTLKGHTDEVKSIAYSPDGRRLASISMEPAGRDLGEVKVWDAQTGQVLLTIPSGGDSVAYSPDGKRLASAGGWQVKVWDAQTGQDLFTLAVRDGVKVTGVRSVAFSPDGKRLASSHIDGTVRVWDAQTGQELRVLKGHTHWVYSVAFSPDGKRLASASADKTVKIWDAQTGHELLTLKGHTIDVSSVVFSPDGKCLASVSSNEVKVWDTQTSQELLTFKGGGTSVTYSPDGKRLAGGGLGVRVWDAQTGQELFTLKGHTGPVRSVAFSPDGNHLASASVDKTVLVRPAQGAPKALTLKGQAGQGASVAFSPDGKRLVSGEGKVWDAQTGQELLTFKGGGTSVTYSPDGKRLAGFGTIVAGEPGKPPIVGLRVWDAQTGEELPSRSFKGLRAANAAVSPDGKRLTTGSIALEKGGEVAAEVKVWDAQTGQELLTFIRFKSREGGRGTYPSVAFNPDGKLLVSAFGHTVKVWDAQTGQELLTFQGGAGSVVFSPDGKRLAGGSGVEVKVWDAQTGQELLSLKGHNGGIYRVAFSPDGKRLASASQDQTVKLWDAQTGQELLTFEGLRGNLAFSPDGHRLASVGWDGTVTIWDATPLPEKR